MDNSERGGLLKNIHAHYDPSNDLFRTFRSKCWGTSTWANSSAPSIRCLRTIYLHSIQPDQEIRPEPLGEQAGRPQGFEPLCATETSHAGGRDQFRQGDVDLVRDPQRGEGLVAQVPPDRASAGNGELDQGALLESQQDRHVPLPVP